MISDPAQKPAAADPVLAKAAENAAAAALKTLADVKKPDNVAEDAWAKQLTQFKVFLNGVAAQAATVAKDCASAVAVLRKINNSANSCFIANAFRVAPLNN